MSRHVPSNLDVRLGDRLLPAGISRITTDHRGALAAYVDPTSHDLELLAAVGAAIRDEGRQVADYLVQYAEIRDRADMAERDGDHALKASLIEDAANVIADIECAMEVEIGDTLVATLRPAETTALVDALAGEAVAA